MPDLTFLGIGSAFCPQLGNTSAFFFRQDTLHLLDCGALVFAELFRHGLLEKAKRIVVLLTHTHADHAGSLGTLISYCKHVRPMPIYVVHPEDKVDEMLRLNGITPEQYFLHAGKEYRDQCIHAQFHAVPHTKALNAYGILLRDGEETIYYSGDAGDVPEPVWRDFLSGHVARIYQDVSLHGKKGGAHGEYAWFVQHCPAVLRASFFPMHLDEACREQGIRDGFGQARLIAPL